ncbi:MAG: Holliday junction DNA helicase RuvA [Actinobacteria bacterium RBG_16_68_21]|nr:MAG: Holliday junction DNA helicase RuvA [Actinobacteria bacterium RBG_16_68_21]
MIGRVRGTLVEHAPSGVVIDVAGIGYEIAMPGRDFGALPAVGEEVVLHTHLHVREDQMALFGFATAEGRDLFRELITVSGVGPKLALAILSTFTPERLRLALVSEDVDALVEVPGIGKRSAQKMILDLRARLELAAELSPAGGSSLAQVRGALEGLGYGAPEIREAIAGLDADGEVDELLRSALQRLGRP